MIKKESFEQNIEFINGEILKRKSKWNLTALSWMDFDDVSQILRAHIYNKWHLYDPSKPLGPWLNRIISNQIKNLIRNNYGNFAKPCLRCAAAESESDCTIYGVQDTVCPLFNEWYKTKKSAYDIKLASSIESYKKDFIDEKESVCFNYEINIKNFNIKIKNYLKPFEYEVYKLLFIENKSEKEAAKKMGYKTTEKDRNAGGKHIRNIKKTILNKAKKLLKEGEIDIYD